MYKFFQLLYFSNILTSLTGAILVFGIIKLLGVEDGGWYPIFIFFAILATYTYQRWRRYIRLINTTSEHVAWIKSHQYAHLFVFIIGCVGSLFFIINNFQLCLKLIPWLILPGIISLWYVHSFFGIILREVPYLKSLLVVFTWLTLVIWIPAFLFGFSSNLLLLHISIIHFFVLFGILVLFDVRDVEYDSLKIKTLPILIGVNYGKFLAVYCFSFALLYGMVTECITFVGAIVPILYMLLSFCAKPKGPMWYFALLDILLGIQGLVYCFM